MPAADTTHRVERPNGVAHHLEDVAREEHVELAFELKDVALLVPNARTEPIACVLEARPRPRLERRRHVCRKDFGGTPSLHLERPKAVRRSDVEAALPS